MRFGKLDDNNKTPCGLREVYECFCVRGKKTHTLEGIKTTINIPAR